MGKKSKKGKQAGKAKGAKKRTNSMDSQSVDMSVESGPAKAADAIAKTTLPVIVDTSPEKAPRDNGGTSLGEKEDSDVPMEPHPVEEAVQTEISPEPLALPNVQPAVVVTELESVEAEPTIDLVPAPVMVPEPESVMSPVPEPVIAPEPVSTPIAEVGTLSMTEESEAKSAAEMQKVMSPESEPVVAPQPVPVVSPESAHEPTRNSILEDETRNMTEESETRPAAEMQDVMKTPEPHIEDSEPVVPVTKSAAQTSVTELQTIAGQATAPAPASKPASRSAPALDKPAVREAAAKQNTCGCTIL